MSNWRTTLLGIIAGIALYVTENGVKMPSNKQEWWTFGFGCAIAVVGYFLRDPNWLRKIIGGTTNGPQIIKGLVIIFCFSLVGCAGGLGYQNMSPEQIAAAVKDKAAGLSCVSGVYAGATVTAIFINVDKGMPTGMTIDPLCKVTFSQPSNPTP